MVLSMTNRKASLKPYIFRLQNDLEHETNSEEGWWRLVPKKDIGGWLAANMRGPYRFIDAARFRGGKTGAVKIDRAKRFVPIVEITQATDAALFKLFWG